MTLEQSINVVNLQKTILPETWVAWFSLTILRPIKPDQIGLEKFLTNRSGGVHEVLADLKMIRDFSKTLGVSKGIALCMYLKLAEIYLFQEPKIPRSNYVLRFCLLSGLSGTSFTGYPLPDVAAGINLKNHVPPTIMVLFGCCWNQIFRTHFQGQIFKKDLFGKESATGRNLRKRMSGSAEVDSIKN